MGDERYEVAIEERWFSVRAKLVLANGRVNLHGDGSAAAGELAEGRTCGEAKSHNDIASLPITTSTRTKFIAYYTPFLDQIKGTPEFDLIVAKAERRVNEFRA